MSHDQCTGKATLQFPDQLSERLFLRDGPRVLGMPCGVQSAFVADADGMPVMPLAVCTGLLQRPSRVDHAVAGDVEMITDVAEMPVADMVAAASLEIQAPPLRGGGAMENDQRDDAHGSVRLIGTGTDSESARDGRSHGEQDLDKQSPLAFRGTRIGIG